ncbi:MAG: VWA domain-containing protein, partial [Acidobacteriales bacterium]
LTLLLDASASMGYGSHRVNKLDYARYLAASLCYMAHHQRDAAGLIVFDDAVRNHMMPSSRHGQLMRLLHAIERIELGRRTDFQKPFLHFQEFLFRPGIVAVISDFYEKPEVVVRTVEPLRFRGNELILFHVLDPKEIDPGFRRPVLLRDMESDDAMDVTPEYAHTEYRAKIDAHIESLESSVKRAGMDYFLLNTSRPLDEALREYMVIRQGRI